MKWGRGGGGGILLLFAFPNVKRYRSGSEAGFKVRKREPTHADTQSLHSGDANYRLIHESLVD